MSEAERRRALERAGWNVLNLDAADVRLDVLSDVPTESPVSDVARAGTAAAAGAHDPDLAELATRIYGPARYLAVTKGRAAERVLAAALDPAGKEILTHGLFRTTQLAFVARGARFETARLDPTSDGRCDLDLGWIDERLARGGIAYVYLEPSNNGLGGRPLGLANLERVAAVCRRNGVKLLLDATRLLANCVALGLPTARARDYTALADAFTVSAAKELLVPFGALVAVRDDDLLRRAYQHAFDEGVLLEPLAARLCLASGIALTAADPSWLLARAAHLRRLATRLERAGVPMLPHTGAHAVFVDLDAVGLGAEVPLRARALEALFYLVAGARALFLPNAALGRRCVARLTLALGRFRDEDVDAIADGMAAVVARAGEAPTLRATASSALPPMLARYQAA